MTANPSTRDGSAEASERLAVMISSTSLDLPHHRETVNEAIRRLGYYPLAMEHGSAEAGSNALSFSLRMVDQADLFIGIIAFRYGYVPDDPVANPNGWSVTEHEYRRAVARGIPVLIFLMQEDHPDAQKNAERSKAAKEKLRALKAELATQHICGFFRSVDQLQARVIQSMSEIKLSLLQRHGRYGAARPFQAPPVPAHYVRRPDEEKRLEDDPSGHRKRLWLVIVAVGRYADQAMPQLPGVPKDANRLAEVFREQAAAPLGDIIPLHDEEATRDRILDALEVVGREALLSDQVVVWFGGHGHEKQGGDSKLPDGMTRYLLPFDATWETAETHGISARGLAEALSPIRASEVVVVLDCCHSGGLTPVFAQKLGKLLQGNRTRYVLAAARPIQLAMETDAGSLLTQSFCDALEGRVPGLVSNNGCVSAAAAGQHVRDCVLEEATQHQHKQEAVAFEIGGTVYLTRAAAVNKAIGKGLPPRPQYRDQLMREVAERSEELRRRRRELLLRGGTPADLAAVEAELLELKRRLRDGPRLAAGDCLSDRYLLIEQLGSGGFATVWKAFDEEHGRLVALKVLHGQYADNPERRDRFCRGARAMQVLVHRHVTRILDPYREDSGHHYFVMEFAAGGSLLQAVLAKKVAGRQVARVILQIGDALTFAHGQGIVHRDVTPDNILLDEDGSARLTDFDLARLQDSTGGTRTGSLGKFVYAAPESLESAGRVDQRCDVYSLGMTAVFGYHGKRLPPVAFTRQVAFLRQMRLPKRLKAVLAGAVRHDPARRYGTVKEFCDALRAACRKRSQPGTSAEGRGADLPARPTPGDQTADSERDQGIELIHSTAPSSAAELPPTPLQSRTERCDPPADPVEPTGSAHESSPESVPGEAPAPAVKDVFDQACAITSPAERNAYLDQACTGHPELRRKVEALLQAYEAAGSFQEEPATTGPYLLGADAPEPSSPVESETGAALPFGRASPSEGPYTRIGPYRLVMEIGRGGMGAVYLAEQEQPVRRRVALKIIKPGMDSEHIVARFEAERQALALMDHDNIARIFDAGTTGTGLPYFVMQLVQGVPITRFCNDNALTLRQRLELFIPLCQAVQHAHEKGVLHRDIKPSNVLVAMQDGKAIPRIIDFGVAKAMDQPLAEHLRLTESLTEQPLTLIGSIIGTLQYMSPEQADASPDVDTRSDVYSLGVLLYELLTGTTPLDHSTLRGVQMFRVLIRIREEEPPRASARVASLGERLPKIAEERQTQPTKLAKMLRGELDWILMKALEKDRNRRYESAIAIAQDVQRYLKDELVEACPPSVLYRLGKLARKPFKKT
jgi:serine/threonine protein kinase